MTECIDQMLHMELLSAPKEPVALPALLSYRRRDPFAVHVTFHTEPGGPVPWVFSRELLSQGMHEPSGEGDIRLWPSGSGPGAVLHLALSSPHGYARLRTPLPALAEWLRRTYLLVPAGHEGDHMNCDAELSRLLHGAP
ncbi:SsgA family sporulation/cell division regulator [Streptomyces sp. NPDC052309]|uniref:SsgA family sporulation/cell division regulator n=1 Tax=Streptomyces sp. NPDC052309 TaxID=3155421 RepID=UPI003425E35B